VRNAGKADPAKSERDARDVELINRYAGELNVEVLDCLEYQADLYADEERRPQQQDNKTSRSRKGRRSG